MSGVGTPTWTSVPARSRASKAWRITVLLICNLIFLGSFMHRPAEAVPFAAFVLLGYGFVFAIQNGAPKLVRPLAVVRRPLKVAGHLLRQRKAAAVNQGLRHPLQGVQVAAAHRLAMP